jgi:hypothetical protein
MSCSGDAANAVAKNNYIQLILNDLCLKNCDTMGERMGRIGRIETDF